MEYLNESNNVGYKEIIPDDSKIYLKHLVLLQIQLEAK